MGLPVTAGVSAEHRAIVEASGLSAGVQGRAGQGTGTVGEGLHTMTRTWKGHIDVSQFLYSFNRKPQRSTNFQYFCPHITYASLSRKHETVGSLKSALTKL